MIEKTPSFKTSDGNVYATLEIAQRAELLKLLTTPDSTDTELRNVNIALDTLFGCLDEVKAILGCTGRKPRTARKDNGKSRKRKTPAVADKEGRPA